MNEALSVSPPGLLNEFKLTPEHFMNQQASQIDGSSDLSNPEFD